MQASQATVKITIAVAKFTGYSVFDKSTSHAFALLAADTAIAVAGQAIVLKNKGGKTFDLIDRV
jgi:hypothetical protein